MKGEPAGPTPSEDPAPTDLGVILAPDWLSAALSDVDPGDRIVDVDVVDTSATLASKVRFEVTVESPDGVRRKHPYCLKAHFGEGSPDTLSTETLVYRELTPRLAVRTPKAYYTGIDDTSDRSLIIMDDVDALGGTFLNAFEPYSVVICRDTLGQLARLHAATWHGDRWDVPWLEPRLVFTASMFPVDYLQSLLDDGRGVDVAPELLDAHRLLAAVAATDDLPATCVIHGDTHSGNVYLDAEGRACWLDWQVTQRGNWAVDVAYHLGTVLSVEDRRAHEADLLRGYLSELAVHGVEPPAWDEAWDLYTRAFAWGFLLWTITRISSREVVLVHMPRLGAALSDHDTWHRLGI